MQWTTDYKTIFSWVEDLYNLGIRRPATAPDLEAEEYIACRFREFGIEDVRKDPIPIMGWESDEPTLGVMTPKGSVPIRAVSVAYSPFTGREGSFFRMVPVGRGTEAEVKGRGDPSSLAVVELDYGSFPFEWVKDLAYMYHDPDETLPEGYLHVATWLTSLEEEIFARCRKEGFGGLIFIHPFDLTPYICSPQSAPLEGRVGPLPLCVLPRSHGDRLLDLIRQGNDRCRLVITGRTFSGVTHNVLGFLPGLSEEVILVSSHHDSMWEGATEDASGVAVVLALAQYFAALPRKQRAKSLVFNIEAAEQLLVIGGTKLMEMHREDIFDRLLVDVHIEHIARETLIEGSGFRLTDELQPRALFVSEVPSLRTAVERMVTKHDLRRTAVLPTNTPLGVQTDAIRFVEQGYPVISFVSAPAYWNAREDTLDKVPAEELERVARAFASLIQEDLFQLKGEEILGRTWNRDRLP